MHFGCHDINEQILTLEPDGGEDKERFTSDDPGDFPQSLHAYAQDDWPTFSLKGTIIVQDSTGSLFLGGSQRLSEKPCWSPRSQCSSLLERRGGAGQRLQQASGRPGSGEAPPDTPVWKLSF